MNDLVVVHANGLDHYTDTPNKFLDKKTKEMIEVVRGIRNRMKKTLEEGHSVYFLPSDNKDLYNTSSFKEFRCVADVHPFLVIDGYPGRNKFRPQFLHLKYDLVNDNISQVDLSGVWRDVCVEDVYFLLTARCSKRVFEGYRKAAKFLGLDDPSFKKIYETRIQCNVLKNLCV